MKAQIIVRPNRLKAKVAGSDHGGQAAVATELIDQAAQVIADYAQKYPAQADIDLTRLLEAAAEVVGNSHSCAEQVQRLRREALEIMGQAETFGFVLMTLFAHSLYDLSQDWTALNARRAELLQVHLVAISLIVRQRIMGDGGDIGRELVHTLAAAKAKFARGD